MMWVSGSYEPPAHTVPPPLIARLSVPSGPSTLLTTGGGTVWAGGSYDPQTHIMYVYSRKSPASLNLIKPDPTKNDMNYISGSALTGARATNPMGAAPGRPVIIVAPPAPNAPPQPEGAGGGGGEG